MVTRLAALLGIGAVLALGRAAVFPAEPEWVVVVGAGASVDEAILVDQALRSDWVRTDPVIRRRLIENLRFAGQEGSDQALFDRALGLGMARTDPVVRARLLERSQALLRAVSEPTDSELQTWLSEHRAAFAVQETYLFHQSFLGEDGETRTPLPALDDLQEGSEAALAARFGASFAAEVTGLAVGEHARIRSQYGIHTVHQLIVHPPRDPTVDEVRPALVQAVNEARGRWAIEARMAQLRARYRVQR